MNRGLTPLGSPEWHYDESDGMTNAAIANRVSELRPTAVNRVLREARGARRPARPWSR